MVFQQGTLILDYFSFCVTDGIEYYKILSPSLLFRLFYKKKKRDRLCGEWLIIYGIIIWFRKRKYFSEASISKEKIYYKRKEVKTFSCLF
jgi:hypothetical protein